MQQVAEPLAPRFMTAVQDLEPPFALCAPPPPLSPACCHQTPRPIWLSVTARHPSTILTPHPQTPFSSCSHHIGLSQCSGWLGPCPPLQDSNPGPGSHPLCSPPPPLVPPPTSTRKPYCTSLTPPPPLAHAGYHPRFLQCSGWLDPRPQLHEQHHGQGAAPAGDKATLATAPKQQQRTVSREVCCQWHGGCPHSSVAVPPASPARPICQWAGAAPELTTAGIATPSWFMGTRCTTAAHKRPRSCGWGGWAAGHATTAAPQLPC